MKAAMKRIDRSALQTKAKMRRIDRVVNGIVMVGVDQYIRN